MSRSATTSRLPPRSPLTNAVVFTFAGLTTAVARKQVCPGSERVTLLLATIANGPCLPRIAGI